MSDSTLSLTGQDLVTTLCINPRVAQDFEFAVSVARSKLVRHQHSLLSSHVGSSSTGFRSLELTIQHGVAERTDLRRADGL